ncbi:hypothetical protein F2Q69_00050399 [Brassica cretica]|uniref:DUF1985 domain-containing protein n=1 Tax=Brassica cretica TaxID=69181 RepID=A0A8S9Q2B9_BRACR|nr:hypothetical protein F2Q69_00050399 [Brassica cretica]
MVLGDTVMPASRKLRLCLIIIVDGVLVPTSQKPKPSLKHVNLVKNLKKFFAFQWGRESFLWAIRTMKPGPKEMGKCEDPNGDLCKMLRQKTIRILGFPLALQLVAFELIPQLLKQARGDDSITLLTFPGQVLPQHAGLNVVDLRKAEHNPRLAVLSMMEISGTHDDRWAAWDNEKYDKKVDNLLGLIKSGHVFSKGDWGGGDGGEPIFVYRDKVNGKKQKGAAHCGVTKAPVLKQRRVSGYFRRGAMVDVEQYRRMEARVQELVLEVQQLKDVVEKQGRKFEKWKTFVKGKSAMKKQGSVKSRGKRRTVEGRKGMELRSQDDEAEDDDDRVEDDVPAFSAGGTQGEGGERTPEQSSRSISEERPSLLVRLPAGDGVPLQWVEPGTGDKVVYRALHSQTFFVSEDEGNSVGGGSRDQGRSGDGLDASAMTDLDALVLAASGDMAGGRKSEGTTAEVADVSGKVVDVEVGAPGVLLEQSMMSFENEAKEGVTVGPHRLGSQMKGSRGSEGEEKPDGAEEMGEQLSVDEAGRFQEGKSGWTDGLGEQGRDVIESERHVLSHPRPGFLT